MILTGYYDFFMLNIHDRMIGAMMTEFHFNRTPTGSQSQQLMPQAHPEQGDFLP